MSKPSLSKILDDIKSLDKRMNTFKKHLGAFQQELNELDDKSEAAKIRKNIHAKKV